ncbi:hypothetical protein R5H28_04330 [Acinetobacter baumannii]|uniref:hypothetical protein n=1 Tax=Acinetobacter baumannii TaxID=470 RepID=UPI002965D2F2|nr:hypothetical protein [Acinetobacter baumannii]MDW3025739.1 hypothetical protein [Acinetobacter baumannii]
MNILENQISLFDEDYAKSYPLTDTPVSYDKEGNVLSRFGDPIWDFSCYIYSPNHRKHIFFNNFNFIENKELKNKVLYEYKLIIYGMLYCNLNTPRSISIQTIISTYLTNLRLLFYTAIDCNTSLSGMSKNSFLMKMIFKKISFLDRKRCATLLHLFKKMSALSVVFKNHDFTLTNDQDKYIQNIRLILKDNPVKQHLVIPSEIYFKLNVFIDDHLFFLKENLQSLLDIYFLKASKVDFMDTVYKKNIENYCLQYNITNQNILVSHLYRIISLALTKIIMFSGMRHGEALLLPFNCLEVIELNNNSIYTLTGFTSKLTQSGPVKSTWITSSQVQTAIEILQAITKAYLKSINVDLNSINYEKVPLISISSRRTKQYLKSLYDYPMFSSVAIKKSLDALSFNSKIDANSMRELELTTSSLVGIEKYGIEIGSDFPFTPHQFRRSLTVYAARSGIVNLPALKGQLKHIKRDMTLYYANNAMNSVNLFDNELVDSFIEELAIEQYLNFKEDVLDAIDPLYGAEGSRLQNSKNGETVPIFLEDEKAALKDIKEGKMSYRRTPLGGCARVGSCDEISELTITSCISCKDAIFSDRTDKALRIALRNFQIQLKSIPEDSAFAIHLRAEINQINILLGKRKQTLESINAAR